jgi:hypothetical protein
MGSRKIELAVVYRKILDTNGNEVDIIEIAPVDQIPIHPDLNAPTNDVLKYFCGELKPLHVGALKVARTNEAHAYDGTVNGNVFELDSEDRWQPTEIQEEGISAVIPLSLLLRDEDVSVCKAH